MTDFTSWTRFNHLIHAYVLGFVFLAVVFTFDHNRFSVFHLDDHFFEKGASDRIGRIFWAEGYV